MNTPTPTPPATARPHNGARRLWLLILAIVVLLAAAGYGVYWFGHARYFETTDDAYVNGDVVQISSQEPGTVLAVHVDDTQTVAAGAPLVELDPADAKIAADVGADALVVSNHGGRQLDGAPATITVLPDIVEAVGDRIEVLFDGGIRSGQDVLKALARGAKGCLIGRAFVYGLAAMGQAGVTKALSVIRDELRVSMSLTGVRDVNDITRDILYDDGARAGSNT